MWWTPESNKDSKASIKARLAELWAELKYIPEKTAILVGHSLLFREMCRQHLSADFIQANSEFAQQLKALKMANAACLFVKVRFYPVTDNNRPPEIVDAKLMWGTRLKGQHEADESNDFEADEDAEPLSRKESNPLLK